MSALGCLRFKLTFASKGICVDVRRAEQYFGRSPEGIVVVYADRSAIAAETYPDGLIEVVIDPGG